MQRRKFLGAIPLLGLGGGVAAAIPLNITTTKYDVYPSFFHPVASALIESEGQVVKSNVGTIGSFREDRAKGRLIKQFRVDGYTCGRSKPQFNTEAAMDKFFKCERVAYDRLGATPFLPSIYEIDTESKSIVMEKLDGDLFTARVQNRLVPDESLSQSLIELLKLYRNANLSRENLYLSNLCLRGSQLVGIDYKTACERNAISAREEVRQLMSLSGVLYKKSYLSKVLNVYADVLGKDELTKYAELVQRLS